LQPCAMKAATIDRNLNKVQDQYEKDCQALEILKSINIVLISTSSGVERAVADNQLDGRVLRLLNLAGFSEQIYVNIKDRLACELS